VKWTRVDALENKSCGFGCFGCGSNICQTRSNTGFAVETRRIYTTMAAQHLLLIWSCLVPTLGATTEREALRALANATNLQGWQRRTNWLTQAPICDWEGVGCDRDGSVRPRRRALSTAEKHTSIS